MKSVSTGFLSRTLWRGRFSKGIIELSSGGTPPYPASLDLTSQPLGATRWVVRSMRPHFVVRLIPFEVSLAN